jgi:hypothetical protein
LAIFFGGENDALIYIKVGWATFWAIFSQTHLVTRIGGNVGTSLTGHKNLRPCPGGVVYIVASSPAATEETGTMGREIESRKSKR